MIKRDGSRQKVLYDKITARIANLCDNLNPDYIIPEQLTQKVVAGLYPGVTTSELDELAAQTAAYNTTRHPDFAILASRISVSNLHKTTKDKFSEVVADLRAYIHPVTGKPAPLIAEDVAEIVAANAERLDAAVRYERSFEYDYFGFKTLERSYLLKMNDKIAERPQQMLMRVAVGIHKDDLDAAIETYDLLSGKWFIHASPTLFNAGTPKPQCSSCFLIHMKEDSIEGIYDTLKVCAQISKCAGGIGINVHNIRASGSYIAGTNGSSNGLVPMLRVFNNTARYVDQCFLPETIIHTSDGPVAIKDTVPGQLVLTAAGNMRPIEKVLEHNYEGEMLQVSIKYAVEPVTVTPQHQVLALKEQALGLNYDVLRTRLTSKYASPEMVDASELRVGDFLCFPVPTGDDEQDIAGLTTEDAWFYGLLLGDGWVGPQGSGLSLGLTDKDESVRARALAYLESREIHVTIDEHAETNNVHYLWSTHAPGFMFTRDQVYDETNEKIIDPAFFRLPKDKLLAIFNGVFDADGCILEEVTLEMSSKPVIEGMRHMLMRCGILTSGYVRDGRGTYVLRIPRVPEIMAMYPGAPAGKYADYLVHDGMMYTRITDIDMTEYAGPVYDYEVADEHTYVTNMGAVHNGGGKRKGAFAIYLEPWHADIFGFLELKKNHGTEEMRARDLFYGLWVPDLFMERVKTGGMWSLMCPHECPGLSDVHSEEFNELYTSYEAEGRYREQVPAQKLWFAILEAQSETGTPYMLYKDSCNRKSNQKNLGTIKSSNLCTEIIEYTAPDEVAVCNLASIALNRFVDAENKTFDFEQLARVVKVATRNLNKIIDLNYYPVEEAERSNLRHRPIGIGVQGLADVFILMRFPFDSPEAAALNRDIFETMYFAALEASTELAEAHGPYETFEGSPASQGILQFDMWGVDPTNDRHDWDGLKARIVANGLRNSLLLAPMPTASTSQILGNNECIEPYTSNMYMRRVLSGEFQLVNKHLLRDLVDRGLWSDDLKTLIIAHGGSVQNIDVIPDDLKALYKTAWELKQRVLVDMATSRGAFIDQSQSFNVFFAQPSFGKLSSLHFHAWESGAKTGMYYLRSQGAAEAIQFTVDKSKVAQMSKEEIEAKAQANIAQMVCGIDNRDECISCGS